jgi:hypothetical protein
MGLNRPPQGSRESKRFSDDKATCSVEILLSNISLFYSPTGNKDLAVDARTDDELNRTRENVNITAAGTTISQFDNA